MKNTLKCLLFLSLLATITSCSKMGEQDIPDIKIKGSISNIQPFEQIKLQVNLSPEQLCIKYDSIVWASDGSAIGPFQFNVNGLDSDVYVDNRSYKVKILVTDYRPGTHKVYLKGYKGGVAKVDSVQFNVVSKCQGDFFSVKWSENAAKYLYFSTNYYPFQKNGITLALTTGTESTAFLRYSRWYFSNYDNPTIEQYRQQAKEIRTLFHNFLTQMYGNSTLQYEGLLSNSTLNSEYLKRFKYVYSDEYHPVEIWDTPTSHIAIIALGNDNMNNSPWFEVVAEPRKF